MGGNCWIEILYDRYPEDHMIVSFRTRKNDQSDVNESYDNDNDDYDYDNDRDNDDVDEDADLNRRPVLVRTCPIPSIVCDAPL